MLKNNVFKDGIGRKRITYERIGIHYTPIPKTAIVETYFVFFLPSPNMTETLAASNRQTKTMSFL